MELCAADLPGLPQIVTVPDLQGIIALRFMLRCAQETPYLNQSGRHKRIGAATGRPDSRCEAPILVRHGGFRIRWISRILLDAANEIERAMERLVVLWIWRNIGL